MRDGQHDIGGLDSSDESRTAGTTATKRKGGRARSVAMKPRRPMVKVHRWLSIGLMAWLVVIALSGAWLVERRQLDAWIHPDRYETTKGDVGPQAAVDAVEERFPKRATIYGVSMPDQSRGVYQVGVEVSQGDPDAKVPEEAKYFTGYVDPGSGTVNAVVDEQAGFTQWLYRGHMHLWQDHGVFGVFDAQTGWCRVDGAGNEPGGVKGVVCDVIPNGDDMVAWFAVGWLVVLFGGFYLWYWPGVRRWANALRVQRGRGAFTFNLSLHKVIGLVCFVPLTIIAFTGIAFAFPNLSSWYQNITPAERGFELWTPPDSATASEKAQGREPLTYDEVADLLGERFPNRSLEYLTGPLDKKGVFTAWMTRGFSPWTRETGAGNVYVSVDQYTGEVLDDSTPGEGNVFNQAWDDYSFPLHTGDFGGPLTRIVWVFVGLSPIVLGATGITMYLIRRRKRARRSASSTARTIDLARAEVDATAETEERHAPVG